MGGGLQLKAEEMLALCRDFGAQGKRLVYRGAPTGTSMWPTIRAGDGIVVEQVGADAIRVGDVLVFSTGGEKLVAHRLIRVREIDGVRHYVMRGDCRRRADRPVAYESVVGKVVAIERAGKTIPVESLPHRLRAGIWLAIHPLPIWAWAAFRRLFPKR